MVFKFSGRTFLHKFAKTTFSSELFFMKIDVASSENTLISLEVSAVTSFKIVSLVCISIHKCVDCKHGCIIERWIICSTHDLMKSLNKQREIQHAPVGFQKFITMRNTSYWNFYFCGDCRFDLSILVKIFGFSDTSIFGQNFWLESPNLFQAFFQEQMYARHLIDFPIDVWKFKFLEGPGIT